RFAIPPHRLGFILRNTDPFVVPEAQIKFGRGEILLGSLARPSQGFDAILRNAAAFTVENTQIELSHGVSLLGRSAIPLQRFDVILRNAAACGVAAAEKGLSFSEIILGSFAQPLHRLDLIFRDAKVAIEERLTQVKLRLRIPLFCFDADFPKQLTVGPALLSSQLKDSRT